MHCPECKSLNEANAAACSSCGLLLLGLSAAAAPAPQKRRADDQAVQKRRTADKEQDLCKFCSGPIAASAIRCKHCSEIVNDDYYRERSSRLRTRVNYASWVAYLFGLAALLVFRPVGLFSISAGLLLSIAYYAIPVEPPASVKSGRKRSSFGSFLRRQLRMERVAIPIPALRNRKFVFVGTPLVAALIGYSMNLFLLQDPVDQVIAENAAFKGMEISAHYQYWVVPGVVVYDLKKLDLNQTPIDVHTAFLEFAKKMKEKRYSRVELSHQGVTKFSIDGASFAKLGNEYAKRNFKHVLYEFPRAFRGLRPAGKTNGQTDSDALREFHRQWYGDDQLTQSVANGL